MTTSGDDHPTTPPERPSAPSSDPDVDPEMLSSRPPQQPSQAEGDDAPEENGEQ